MHVFLWLVQALTAIFGATGSVVNPGADSGGVWDPNGNPRPQAGSVWDPNG